MKTYHIMTVNTLSKATAIGIQINGDDKYNVAVVELMDERIVKAWTKLNEIERGSICAVELMTKSKTDVKYKLY